MGAIPLVEQIGSVAALGAGGGGGFFAVKWFAEWMGGRFDKREARIDKATQLIIDRLDADVTTLRERVEQVEHDLRECHKKHADSEAETMRLRALLDAQGEIRQRAAQVVAADRLGAEV